MRKVHKRIFVLIGAALIVLQFSGCTSLKKQSSPKPSYLFPEQLKKAVTSTHPSKPAVQATKGGVRSPQKEQLEKPAKPLSFPSQKPSMQFGVVGPKAVPGKEPEVPSDKQKQKIVLNFDKAEIQEVSQQIFGRLLGVNYVLDPSLRMPVTFYLEGNYTKTELLHLVTQVYKAYGIDVVLKNGVYHILLAPRTPGTGLQIIRPEDLKAKDLTKPAICLYRLQFLSAQQAQNLIKPFMSPNRPLIFEPITNTLVMVDSVENIKTLVEMLHLLDVNVFNKMGIEIVKLKYMDPKEASEAFDTIAKKLSPAYKNAISRNLVVIPVPRISALILVSPDRNIIRTAKEWITALDVEGESSEEQFYVYFVKNGLAKNIVDILKQVFTGSESETHLEQHVVKAEEKKKESSIAGEGVSAKLKGEISIIADETNNAIIVKALPQDYEKIRKAIEALDVLPRAVIIEMLIAEITLNDETAYGVEWYLKNKGMNIGGYKEGTYSITQNYGVPFERNFDLGTATSQGLSLFWGSIEGDIASLINLLASFSHFKVLSAPTILATDNQEASITVGGSTPIVSQQSVETSGSTLINTVQYVDTGIILTVTPHINEGGIVRLEVEQTIRDAVQNTVSGIDSPAFTERKISTTLLAKDGTTVVLGGIIQQKDNSTRTGIPFLSRIPFLGSLFSSTSVTSNRTELLLAITPRIVEHSTNEASYEFLRKLKLLKEIITKETGSTDHPAGQQ
ncbi:MAG: type II secretion system secretin GspD [Deltaproteobacteria bacterium]|nr:type II secretion system secretin GspD [Deltaproteobacteria bacterium]